MSMYTLAACNGKTIYTVIHPGDKLTVQQSDVTHTVCRGDTLSGIRLGVSVGHLVQVNRIGNPNRIYIGQRLVY